MVGGMVAGGSNAAAVPGWLGAAAGVFAALVAGCTLVFEFTGYRRVVTVVNVLGTIVHEAGHALVCVLTGGGIYRFEVTGPDNGSVTYWHPSKLATIATGMAGYAMPTLAGLGAAALIHHGHPAGVLLATVITMGCLLLVARDFLTLLSVVLVGGLAFIALRWGPASLQDVLTYTESWLLLTSELGGLTWGIVGRFRGLATIADAQNLATRTRIPGAIWIIGWLVFIAWGIWHAAPMLLD